MVLCFLLFFIRPDDSEESPEELSDYPKGGKLNGANVNVLTPIFLHRMRFPFVT